MDGVKTSQRARLLALLLGILILGVIGQSMVIKMYLLEDFRRLEESQVRASGRLINLWLDNFLQPLDTLARSSADAANARGWPAELLDTAERRSTVIDVAAVIGPDGSLLRGFARGPNGGAAPLSAETASYLQRHMPLPAGGSAGWIATPGSLLATAARPQGREGVLVLGRYFTGNDLVALQDISGTRLDVMAGSDTADGSGGVRGEVTRGGEGNRPLQICQPLTPSLNPNRAALCVQLQDSIYLRGKASADDLRLATIGGFVLLILSAALFLDRALLRRLQRLVVELGGARETSTEALENALTRDARTQDELGQLSGGMSGLLTRVRNVEKDLRLQQQNFRSLTESTGVGIFVIADRIRYANPFAELLTGYTFLDLLEKRLPDLLHRNDRERIDARLYDTLAGKTRRMEFDEVRGLRKNGTPYWARLHTVAISYEEMPAVLVTLYDTSEQRHLEAVLAREKERLQIILASIGEGIVSLDPAGNVNYMNTAAERLIGHTATTVIGKAFSEVAFFADPKTNRPLPPSVMEVVKTGGATVAANLMTPFGDTRQVEVHASRMQSGEGINRPGSVIVLRDVSELRRVTQNLEYQAAHDELTGLVNRREFNHRLQDAIDRCRKTGEPYALCYVDLDQFKTVNDICGHHAGDLLLQQITASLRQHIREHDTLARLGGDEFGLLLARCPAEQAVAYANELRGAISEVRFTWAGRVFTLDASVGITMLNHIEGNLDEALSIADATCYVAKEQGRNRVRLYRPGDVDLQRQFGHMRWAQRLKDALEGNQFRLYQQNLVPLTGRAEGPPACEVLLRLQESDGRLVSAADFLEAAERYQLMPAIDRLVVLGVIEHMRLDRTPRRYFVNLSGQSLGDDGFHAFLLETLARTPEAAQWLTFEVTETAVISTLSKARKIMTLLRERGCTFALDDFGTGMSSFVYLKELEVQYLKIAGPFVRNMATSTLDAAIVSNFAAFGRQMGLQTIAEWVENERTLKLLRELGVDFAQGFLLDQPVPMVLMPASIAEAVAGKPANDGKAA
ncbi:MAG TPA: EAL domain-containing protein [Verrucomicrobiae bacterium]|nr:EAL domain-containing protein [Verrucomicrobiae bacterium]